MARKREPFSFVAVRAPQNTEYSVSTRGARSNRELAARRRSENRIRYGTMRSRESDYLRVLSAALRSERMRGLQDLCLPMRSNRYQTVGQSLRHELRLATNSEVIDEFFARRAG